MGNMCVAPSEPVNPGNPGKVSKKSDLPAGEIDSDSRRELRSYSTFDINPLSKATEADFDRNTMQLQTSRFSANPIYRAHRELRNLDDIAEHYDVDWKNEIGKGAQATIHKAVDKRTDQVVAIKVIKKMRKKEMETEDPQLKEQLEEKVISLRQELLVLETTEHPNIVRVKEILEGPRHFWVVLEFIQGGDLHNLIEAEKKLPEELAIKIVYQIVLVLKYLHGRGIVHRDLKPANLMVDKN